MRYYYPTDLAPVLDLERSVREWSISRILFLLGAPLVGIVLLGMTFSTYRIVSHYLNRAYARNAQTRALAQAHEIKQCLLEARNEIQFLARSNPTPDSIRNYMALKPQTQRDRYREIAFHGPKPDDNFVLLNTGDSIWQLPAEQANAIKFGVFSHQNGPAEMNSDYVQVTQPVQTYYSSVPYRGSTQNMEFSVIRFTTQTFDTEGKANGVLTISLDLLVVHRIMSLFSSSQSPLFIFPQDRERTISFFFDSSGWLLFASGFSDNQKKGLSVDTLRSGLQGDIGRPGFDSAFRPSPLHEKYWTMVASVQSGNSGQLALGPLFNNPSNSGSDLFLNYAPIEFPETLLSSPTIVGGIGCMDTSFMFMSATYEVIMALSVALFTAIVLTLGTFYFLHRRISRPVTTLASAVEKRTLGGDASHLEISPLPKELHHLQHTINTLLLQLQTARNEASIRQEMILGELHRQPVYLDKLIKANQSSVQGQSHDPECGIVGQSQAVLNLRAMIQKAAQVMADVLIIGETGTGKELAAEAIHRSSPRAGGPFISINCGALDENLLLDALFGHVKGAFSEAKTDRKGAFLAASSGTLHLDEIGNASPKVQQALLRALSVRHIRPLGSDQDVPFDARVIAATNVDLLECVKNGTFREDLYYRLAVITISTPPLRQRKEDLPLLVHYFLTETTQSQNKPAIDLSRGALDKLLRYDWPGNIRELKNSMTRAVTFAEGGILLASHIILGNTTNSTASDTPPAYPAPGMPPARTLPGEFPPKEHIADQNSSRSPLVAQIEITDQLNPRQKKAWPILLASGGTNRAEYQNAVGEKISVRTAQYDLQDMVNKGLLVKSGKGPASRYILADGVL